MSNNAIPEKFKLSKVEQNGMLLGGLLSPLVGMYFSKLLGFALCGYFFDKSLFDSIVLMNNSTRSVTLFGNHSLLYSFVILFHEGTPSVILSAAYMSIFMAGPTVIWLKKNDKKSLLSYVTVSVLAITAVLVALSAPFVFLPLIIFYKWRGGLLLWTIGSAITMWLFVEYLARQKLKVDLPH